MYDIGSYLLSWDRDKVHTRRIINITALSHLPTSAKEIKLIINHKWRLQLLTSIYN